MKKILFPIVTPREETLPFYLHGFSTDYEQEEVDRREGTINFQWIQCRKGKGILHLGGKRYILSRGQGFILFPGEAHSYHALTESWVVDWVVFKGTAVKDFFCKTMGLSQSGVFYVSNPEDISAKLEILYEASTAQSIEKYNYSSTAYRILLDILFLTSKSENTSLDNKMAKIKPVINYIIENYHKPIILEELSELIGVSPQHLCVLFKKVASMTVFEFINKTRIKFAKQLLTSGLPITIKEISFRTGFNDESYFSSTFKKLEGMTPSQFRDTHVL